MSKCSRSSDLPMFYDRFLTIHFLRAIDRRSILVFFVALVSIVVYEFRVFDSSFLILPSSDRLVAATAVASL